MIYSIKLCQKICRNPPIINDNFKFEYLSMAFPKYHEEIQQYLKVRKVILTYLKLKKTQNYITLKELPFCIKWRKCRKIWFFSNNLNNLHLLPFRIKYMIYPIMGMSRKAGITLILNTHKCILQVQKTSKINREEETERILRKV